MALTESWRRLNFFDKNAVLDPKTGERFNGLEKLQMSCWATPNDGQGVYLGESKGALFALDKNWDQTYWKAYQCTLSDVAAVGNHLLTIGEDEREINSILKVWERPRFGEDRNQEVDCAPRILKEVRLCQLLGPAGFSTRATTITGISTGRVIASGFADGSVMAYIGDYSRDRAVTSRWIRIREPTPIEGEVTGTAIGSLPGATEMFVIFVLTNRSLNSYVMDGRGTIVNKLRHEAQGSSRDCWTFTESNNQFIVANKDMIHIYDAQACLDAGGERGKCYALSRGLEKQQIASFGEFLAVLTKQAALIPASEQEWMTVVTVYDVTGKYIAFTGSLPSLANCFLLDGVFILLAHDGQLSSLTQKHLAAKLDILYKKSFFDVAIDVARRSEGGDEVLPHIHAKYGDFYYAKADFRNAIHEYKESIGVLDPSYVIKKFLDGSKIPHLCEYLQALRAKRRSNVHHTTILVNCYARLKERSKLKELLENLSETAGEAEAAAIVNCLRSAKFFNEATLFALKTEQRDAALSIVVDEQRAYKKAIELIKCFEPAQAQVYLEKYGRRLLRENRAEMMSMLREFMLSEEKAASVNIPLLLQLFVGDEQSGAALMEQMAARGNGGVKLLNTIIELNIRAHKDGESLDVFDKVLKYVCKENEESVRKLAEELKCDAVMEALLQKSQDWNGLHAFYIRRGLVDQAVQLATKINTSQAWLDTLAFISKMKEPVNDELMEQILLHVKETRVLHPLIVLDVLSKSTVLNVAAVKKYVVEWLREQRDTIAADKAAITMAEQKIEEVGRQIENLHFNTQVLQVSKCCACDFALQLPSVFFLCRHAFHVHCFDSYAEKADVCPKCSVEKGPILRMDISDLSLSSKNAHGQFVEKMNKAEDSMEIISKYISSGLFDPKKASPKAPQAAAAGIAPILPPSSSIRSSFPQVVAEPRKRGSTNSFEVEKQKESTNPFD